MMDHQIRPTFIVLVAILLLQLLSVSSEKYEYFQVINKKSDGIDITINEFHSSKMNVTFQLRKPWAMVIDPRNATIVLRMKPILSNVPGTHERVQEICKYQRIGYYKPTFRANEEDPIPSCKDYYGSINETLAEKCVPFVMNFRIPESRLTMTIDNLLPNVAYNLDLNYDYEHQSGGRAALCACPEYPSPIYSPITRREAFAFDIHPRDKSHKEASIYWLHYPSVFYDSEYMSVTIEDDFDSRNDTVGEGSSYLVTKLAPKGPSYYRLFYSGIEPSTQISFRSENYSVITIPDRADILDNKNLKVYVYSIRPRGETGQMPYYLHWTDMEKESGHKGHYSLFLCYTSLNKCQQVKRIISVDNSTHYKLNITAENLKVGISFTYNSSLVYKSTGIVWSSCALIASEWDDWLMPPKIITAKPAFDHSVTNSSANLELSWYYPVCEGLHAAISNYTIEYCPVGKIDSCQSPDLLLEELSKFQLAFKKKLEDFSLIPLNDTNQNNPLKLEGGCFNFTWTPTTFDGNYILNVTFNTSNFYAVRILHHLKNNLTGDYSEYVTVYFPNPHCLHEIIMRFDITPSQAFCLAIGLFCASYSFFALTSSFWVTRVGQIGSDLIARYGPFFGVKGTRVSDSPVELSSPQESDWHIGSEPLETTVRLKERDDEYDDGKEFVPSAQDYTRIDRITRRKKLFEEQEKKKAREKANKRALRQQQREKTKAMKRAAQEASVSGVEQVELVAEVDLMDTDLETEIEHEI